MSPPAIKSTGDHTGSPLHARSDLDTNICSTCNYYANVTLETRSMIRPVGTPNGMSGLKNNIADAPLRVPTVVVFFRTFV